MRLLPLSSACLLGLTALACGTGDATSVHTGATDSEIINGTLDTTREAVVAVLGEQSACTGTIISKDVARGLGYVLTAAHCVDPSFPPVQVRQGNNFMSPTRTYSVLHYQEHPSYGGGNMRYDVGMITISGVDASTPTMDVGPSVSVTNGMSVMSVGYGLTGPGDNTRRYNITKNLNGVNSAIITYSLSGGGICSGDSGGPVLTTGSNQQVIAVHSAVDRATSSSCSGDGYSIRVSAYWDSFIRPYMEEGLELNCATCSDAAQTGACASAVDACIDSTACYDLATCLNECATSECVQGCASTHAAGIPLYNAIIDCTCGTCAEECAAECEGPSCGFQFQDDTCTACHEANCCSQGVACAENAECTTCVTADEPAASCGDNAERTAWFSCLETSCATECGFGGGGSGGAGGSGGSGAGGSGAGGSGGTAGTGAGGSGGTAGTGGASGGTGGVGAEGGSGPGPRTGDDRLKSDGCSVSAGGAAGSSSSPFALGAGLLGLLGLAFRRRR